MKTLLPFLLLLHFSLLTFSQAGFLDPTFDGDGIVITNGGTGEFCSSLAELPDGKIIVVSREGVYPDFDIQLLRYNTDGSLDLSFGINGIATSDNGLVGPYIKMAVTPDNKFVVVGEEKINNKYDNFISMFNTDGSIDSTFGNNGKVIADLEPNEDDYSGSVAVQPDGKIVISGDTYNGLVVARFNIDGTPDSSFSDDGFLEIYSYIYSQAVGDIAFQSDGTMVVAGSTESEYLEFACIKIKADGIPDSTFDGDGIVFTDLTDQSDFPFAVLIQNDGKIILAGTADDNTFPDENPYWAIVRYNADGSLDSSFDGDGEKIFKIQGQNCRGRDAILQPDGKILMTGFYESIFEYSVGLVRFETDGSFDSSFGNNGIVTSDVNGNDAAAFSITLQSDNRILVGGGVGGNGFGNISLLRFLNDCVTTLSDFTYMQDDLEALFTDQSMNADSWFWDFGDGTTSSVQNPSHEYALQGIYSVCLVAGNYCSFDTICQSVSIIATGIQDFSNNILQFTIYPNPVSDFTAIQFSLKENDYVKIELQDMQGRRIQTIAEGNFEEGNNQVNFSPENLSKGIYLLRLNSNVYTSFLKIVNQ